MLRFTENTTTLTQTFYIVPSTTGAITLTATSSPALGTNPSPLSYTSNAAGSNIYGGTDYYVSPTGTGDGTAYNSPYGISDLISSTYGVFPTTKGQALTSLVPGDILYFLGGDYHFLGNPLSYDNWDKGLLAPIVSGTVSQPITLRAFPGEQVNIILDGGTGQPAFGAYNPTLNYVRYIGFRIDLSEVFLEGYGVTGFYIGGYGNEIAYNEIIGGYNSSGSGQNACIFSQNGYSQWIHHNVLHESMGSRNAEAISMYHCNFTIIEDNYIYNVEQGVYDKDAGNVYGTEISTYKRNYMTQVAYLHIEGPVNQSGHPRYFIYDNVLDASGIEGSGELPTSISDQSFDEGMIDPQIYNNLFINLTRLGLVGTYFSGLNYWNNIAIGMSVGVQPLSIASPSQYPDVISYMDYNLYDDTTPVYWLSLISDWVSLAYMRGLSPAFETNTNTAPTTGTGGIFESTTPPYVLKSQWTGTGKDGTTPGPRCGIATVMDTTRYGFANLDIGTDPVVTTHPTNQSVSVNQTATFSVQVTGSGLFYQWLKSTNSGTTWIVIHEAESYSYTTPATVSGDNGTIFRCLISSTGGSAWSQTATLTVS